MIAYIVREVGGGGGGSRTKLVTGCLSEFFKRTSKLKDTDNLN